MDELNGVDFKKGCYIGQEVVSRVQHRGSARKRFRKLSLHAPVPSGGEITAGDISIGTVASVAGEQALGLVRIDRLEDAAGKGVALQSGAVGIDVSDS
jgi:folate-binding Fe-S cluster repair protein YgfZ